MPVRVLHLVGSPVSEFFADLSRLYARDCLAATADPSRYEVVIAYVEPGGRWRFPDDLSAGGIAAAETVTVSDAIARIATSGIDVMVPQMFCIPGMTQYRSLFDLLGIAHVGNTADVMALSADKVKTRAVVAHAGVAVPPGEVLSPGSTPTLVPPVVVKPVDADNSTGVSLVRRPDEFATALETARAQSDRVLVERYVPLGREVRCGTIVRDGEIVCLPLEEYAMDPATKAIRGEADKLARAGDGELNLVAKDSTRAWIVDADDPITAGVWEAARRCHEALGCRHYGLFDFRIDPAGDPWFLEAGLYCSFAPKSVISTMAEAAGIALADLFDAAVTEAMAGPRVP